MENFQSIPEEFNTAEFVTSLTKTEEVTEVSRSLQKSVNDILSYLSQPETLPQTRLFLGAQWTSIFTLVRKQVSADVNKKIQMKEFTCHFADLHSLLVSNDHELEKEFAELVGISVHLLVEQHYHVLTEIVMALNSHILKVIVGERFPSSSVGASSDGPALVLHLFNDHVVTRYVKIGVGEFLREFRRDFKLRKKVVEKKKKKDLVSSKVTVESIKKDTSVNKGNSHRRLMTMLDQQESIFQSNVYSKSELQLLCKAYGLVFRRSDSKALLSENWCPKSVNRSMCFIHRPWRIPASSLDLPDRLKPQFLKIWQPMRQDLNQVQLFTQYNYNKVKYFHL